MTTTPAKHLDASDPPNADPQDHAVGVIVAEHHLDTALALARLLASHLNQARVVITRQGDLLTDDNPGERADTNPPTGRADRCECLADGPDGTPT